MQDDKYEESITTTEEAVESLMKQPDMLLEEEDIEDYNAEKRTYDMPLQKSEQS
jgi:hypothetical protein